MIQDAIDWLYSKEVLYFLSPLFYSCVSYLIYKGLIYSAVNTKLSQYKVEELTTKDIVKMYAINIFGIALLALAFCNENWYRLYRVLILVIPVAAYSTHKGLEERAKVVERYKQYFK